MAWLNHPRFITAMRLAFWLTLLFSLTMAVLPQPPRLPIDSMGDKFAHMLAFAALTFFVGLGFPATNPWRLAERLSFAGALIEVIQSLPMLQRDCDIRDWIADTVAILVVTMAMQLILPRLRGIRS